MNAATSNTVALQLWPHASSDTNALKDVLARVHFERGHFREITEASLQEEIAGQGALQLSDSESDLEAEEDEPITEKAVWRVTTREDLFKARHEMLMSVRAAEQEVWMSLDFISLLISKDLPRQAQSTISPHLKEAVPLGSLGVDQWKRMPVDKAREAQDELLAANVRMQGLQESADSLLKAATRLQSDVRKKTQYWNQVMSISNGGWNICRIPGQKHRLGVNFGFSESAPAFSRRGVAELNANSSGDIMIERAIGSRSKSLRAVIRCKGTTVGASRLPLLHPQNESTLEARIRSARDSLFDEELYHEMIRESRTITSLGVRMTGSAIELQPHTAFADDLAISLVLTPLDHAQATVEEAASEAYNALAQATVLSARLLLGRAHRYRLKKRSEPPPPLAEKDGDETPVLPILRPIMALIMHRIALNQMCAYVDIVSRTLKAANVDFRIEKPTLALNKSSNVTNTDALIAMLMQPWVSSASLSVPRPDGNDTDLGFGIQTTLAYGFGTIFTITGFLQDAELRIDDFNDFVEAADMKISAALLHALVETTNVGWNMIVQEEVATKHIAVGEKAKTMRVTFDSRSQSLVLNIAARRRTWTADEELVQDGLWDAFQS